MEHERLLDDACIADGAGCLVHLVERGRRVVRVEPGCGEVVPVVVEQPAVGVDRTGLEHAVDRIEVDQGRQEVLLVVPVAGGLGAHPRRHDRARVGEELGARVVEHGQGGQILRGDGLPVLAQELLDSIALVVHREAHGVLAGVVVVGEGIQRLLGQPHLGVPQGDLDRTVSVVEGVHGQSPEASCDPRRRTAASRVSAGRAGRDPVAAHAVTVQAGER